MCLGLKLNKDKIGNLIIKLANDIGSLYHTKLLKLLYIIDEKSMDKYGVPITFLDYKVWKLGPVAPAVYSIGSLQFAKYVYTIEDNYGTEIKANKEFCDLDFSDAELKLIDEVIAQYGSKNSEQLIKITHKNGGLWDSVVKANGGEAQLFSHSNASSLNIDFKEKIKNDNYKLDMYTNAIENLEFQASIEC